VVRQLSDDEVAAAEAVKRVLGGTWQPNDDGSEPSQVDVLLDLEDGRRVALEVTSEGDYDVHKARSAINKRANRGEFAGKSLSCMWYVSVSVDRRISDLSLPELEDALREFEVEGLQIVSSRGAHPLFGDPPARNLARLGADSALLWNEAPPSGEPRIILGPSFSVIGTHTSLPEALKRVLARTDNQDKLRAVDADERHLFIHVNDHAAASGLRGVWALPQCPPDPRGVIDSVWIFAPWASSMYLHRVVPGTDLWTHFVMATGEPAPESALSAWQEER
jgi:hypothetical protein